MRTSNLFRNLLPTLALLAAACLQVSPATEGEGDAGTSTGSSSSSGGSGSATGSSSGGSSSGSVTSGTSSSSGGSGSSALTVGSPCTESFGSGGITDPCTAVGLVCQITGVSTSGTCQLPGTGQACNSTTGCVAGDNCVAGARGSTCVQTCTTTADCSSLTQSCDTTTGECGTNECGPDAGTAYYSACDSSGTDDGVCLPVSSGGRNPTTTGVCLETGDAGAYATCSTSRGADDICGAGTYCVAIGGSSACLPLCTVTAGGGGFGGGGTTTDAGTSALDAGSSGSDGGEYTCPAEATCISETEIAEFAGGGGGGGGGGRGGGGGGGVGVCLSSCSSAPCPGNLSCVKVPIGNIGSVCVP